MRSCLVIILMGLSVVFFLGKIERTQSQFSSMKSSRDISNLDSVQILKRWSNYFIDQGLAFPEVVTAQMVHETDFLSSKIFLENKNLFGMKKNSRGYCIGEKNGHALYADVQHSIKDYKAYQGRMLFYAAKQNRYPHTNEEYMALLRDLPQFGCGKGVCYAEDPSYLPSLRKRIEMLKSM